MEPLLAAFREILAAIPDAGRIELRDGERCIIVERPSPEALFCPPPPPMTAYHPAPPPAPVSAPAVPDSAPVSQGTEVLSPIVGTFYAAPAPDAAPFVSVGQRVTKGQTLCIVEAMKLLNEIEAELDGEIVEICVTNGALVEYGQKLFVIKE